MARKRSSPQLRLEQGRQLAEKLYDHKIAQLQSLSDEERSQLHREFPLLSDAEFNDVLRQVIEAKRYEQELVGWQTIPHDAAVLILVLVTAVLDLRAGIVAGVATLVLLESLAQFYFNRQLYRPLSLLVWLTYPAYAVLAYLLYRRDFALGWIVLALVLAWGGTFLLGALARIPVHLLWEARAKSAADAAHMAKEQGKKQS